MALNALAVVFLVALVKGVLTLRARRPLVSSSAAPEIERSAPCRPGGSDPGASALFLPTQYRLTQPERCLAGICLSWNAGHLLTFVSYRVIIFGSMRIPHPI